MPENLTMAMVGFITSLLIALVSNILRMRQDRLKQKFIKATRDTLTHTVNKVGAPQFYGGNVDSPIVAPELVTRMEEQILAQVQSSPSISRDDVQREVASQLAVVQERIKKLENRFPDESNLDKVASINDALLSERIDQLSKQVGNLEGKILSRWDIAIVVSQIIAAIIGIVGATYGVLKGTGIIL